jgi:hypothetical protein
MFTVNRYELLRLFDTAVRRPTRHDNLEDSVGATASAVNGLLGEDVILGLFCDYWRRFHNGSARVISYRCQQGKWLDAWLIAEAAGSRTLFRTEVKNWTAHSSGGHYKLDPDARPELVANRARKQWQRWMHDLGNMKRIEKVGLCQPTPVEGFQESVPLLCFWGPLLSDETAELSPFFEARLPGSTYLEMVNIFSASIYLHSISESEINIEMPRVAQRIEALRRLGVLQ